MSRKKRDLINRLSAYTTAASALLTLSPNAESQINYSGIQNIELNFPEEYLEIDLNGDAIPDFEFQSYRYFYTSMGGPGFFARALRVCAIDNPRTDSYQNSWITRTSFVPSLYLDGAGTIMHSVSAVADGLESGEIVSMSRDLWAGATPLSGPGILGALYTYIYSTWFANNRIESVTSFGDFLGDENFIGVRFHIGTEQHYGWIRVGNSTFFQPLIIYDWAYESTPGEMILAGDTLGMGMPPNLLITGGNGSVSDATRTLSITASEEITGFELSDLIVNNGSAGNFTEITPGWEYTVDITAELEGEVVVEIPESRVTDLDDNPNTASHTKWYYDISGPIPDYWRLPVATNSSEFSVDIKFNERCFGLSSDDFSITNGTIDDIIVNREGFKYILLISHSDEGEVNLELDAGSVIDLTENQNPENTVSWIYDVTRPVPDFNAQIISVHNIETDVDLYFNEHIQHVDQYYFHVTNGSVTMLETIEEHLHYIVTVEADSAAGQVVLSLPSMSVLDFAGNGNIEASESWLYQPDDSNPAMVEGTMIFPNPARGELHIKSITEASVTLTDLNGNTLLTHDHVLDEMIDISRFKQGIYIVQIRHGEEVSYFKISIE